MEYGSVGTIASVRTVSEIAEISRFPGADQLASYGRRGCRKRKAVIGMTERSMFICNHRLKNRFFTAAHNYSLFTPDSSLTGYYRSAKARGMKHTGL